MWLILECSEADQWEARHGGRTIPLQRRPSFLHPTRASAEEEAKRLAASTRNAEKRFLILETVAAGVVVNVPTHVTLGGHVVASQWVASLVDVAQPEDEIPF